MLLAAMPLGVVGFVSAGSTVAWAQAPVVREIRVVGNRRVEPETIRAYVKFQVGDRYSAERVDASLKALFGTGLFSDVRIDMEGAVAVITVAENPVVNRVAFEGNRDVDSATLINEVQLKTRAVFTRARVQADVQRILDVYRRQGLFAASVEPKIIELPHNRVDLVFEITEGGATKVRAINFIGNRAFSDSQLRDIISTGQSGLFDFFKNNNIYDPDRINLDRELLRQYYLKNGYADARVVAAFAEIDREGSGFFITFTVEEGQLYRFGSVEIESALPSVNTAALRDHLLMKPGEIFNASLLDRTVEKLTLVVAEQGYAFARVRPRANRDAATNTVSIVMTIDEGPRVYIERINVVGNSRTQDYVIRREFRLSEGDAFNPMLVDRAKKRLQALGFFKNVEVKREQGSAPDRVILTVEVVEQSTGELSFGAGYSTSEGVIGDVSITERNLLGRGQFLRLKLSGSAERFQIDLSFTEPRFLDRNLAAGFDVFHKDVNQTRTGAFRSRKTGASVRLGAPISEHLWLNTHYTLSLDEIYEVSDVASRAIKEAAGQSLTSMVGYSLTYDTRNHPKSPNRGFYFQFGQDLAGLGGDVQYVRTIAEGRAYYPITDRITLVGRVIAGHIEGWGGDDVRLVDLFYKGGETVRGFAKAGIGPRDTLTGDPLGGRMFYAATAEIRYPIPFVPEELGVSGAVFIDAGSLFDAGALAKTLNTECVTKDLSKGICLSDSDGIRASVGTSLIWNSPIGPLRADFAWAFLKQSVDETQVFRFGASTKF